MYQFELKDSYHLHSLSLIKKQKLTSKEASAYLLLTFFPQVSYMNKIYNITVTTSTGISEAFTICRLLPKIQEMSWTTAVRHPTFSPDLALQSGIFPKQG